MERPDGAWAAPQATDALYYMLCQPYLSHTSFAACLCVCRTWRRAALQARPARRRIAVRTIQSRWHVYQWVKCEAVCMATLLRSVWAAYSLSLKHPPDVPPQSAPLRTIRNVVRTYRRALLRRTLTDSDRAQLRLGDERLRQLRGAVAGLDACLA